MNYFVFIFVLIIEFKFVLWNKTNKDKSTELYKKGQQKVQLCTLPLKELLLRTQQSKENYLFINNNLFNPMCCRDGGVVRADLLAVHLAATLLPAQAAAAAGLTSPCQPNTSLLLLLTIY